MDPISRTIWGWCSVTDCCEHNSETSEFHNGREFLDHLKNSSLSRTILHRDVSWKGILSQILFLNTLKGNINWTKIICWSINLIGLIQYTWWKFIIILEVSCAMLKTLQYVYSLSALYPHKTLSGIRNLVWVKTWPRRSGTQYIRYLSNCFYRCNKFKLQ
jgi:hypothetical protein